MRCAYCNTPFMDPTDLSLEQTARLTAVDEPSAARRRSVFAVIAVGAFMAQLDLFIVNIAFPAIHDSFPGSSTASLSWRLVEYLIAKARIGSVPGVDFGPNGEGYVRFCFARDRKELTGALQSMKELFAVRERVR